MASRALLVLYAATLALLPWSWFPPFPWLREHAQWSDIVFAATVAVWALERWREGKWPRLRPLDAAMALYLSAAAVSLLSAAPDRRLGAWKLVGMFELCALAVVTADLAAHPGFPRIIARAVVATSLAVVAAVVLGLLLFYAGVPTRLIGTYGDLTPSSSYARVQAGTYQPNLLASFCIFASAVVALPSADLPARVRRTIQLLLLVTVILTFSRGILAFGLAAAIRAAHTRSRRWMVGIYAAACVAAIAALITWNFSFNPASPRDTRVDTGAPSSRWQAITSSLDTLASHPLVGSGVGTSPGQYRGIPFDAHLTPLNIAATMGLPALIAFSSMFIILWRQRERPADLAVWSGLAGLALDALAQDIEDFRHLWVMIGLVAAGVHSQLSRRA